MPDPFYGLENEAIIDIADSGREYYTFWFFTTFECKLVCNAQTLTKCRKLDLISCCMTSSLCINRIDVHCKFSVSVNYFSLGDLYLFKYISIFYFFLDDIENSFISEDTGA